jgi:hypothetical protein
MKYGAMAEFGVALTLLIAVSFMFPHLVFAGSYEKKSRVISQTNECGNYLFPVNVIFYNINTQTQGDENNVAITTAPKSDISNGPPFP